MKDWKFKLFLLIVLILAIVIGQAIIANAEIYTWTDIYGTTNFTNDPNKVPGKYPLDKFEFTKERKMTKDLSDTKSANASRLEYLRKFNYREEKNLPQVNVIVIDHFYKKEKKHRARD